MAGKNALELETWTPTSVLQMFRENEICTFYCDTADDGILYDEDKKTPIGLKDRYREIKLSNCGETKNASSKFSTTD